MTDNEKKVLSVLIKKLKCDSEKAKTVINEKNLIQAKLHIAKFCGLPVPLEFETIDLDTPPFSVDLVRFINEDEPVADTENKTLHRPYNKIICIINALDDIPHDKIPAVKWFEILSCCAYCYHKDDINGIFRRKYQLSDQQANAFEKLIKELRKQTTEPADMPKVKGTCLYIDIFAEEKVTRKGILFENGIVMDIETGDYIGADEAIIKTIEPKKHMTNNKEGNEHD